MALAVWPELPWLHGALVAKQWQQLDQSLTWVHGMYGRLPVEGHGTQLAAGLHMLREQWRDEKLAGGCLNNVGGRQPHGRYGWGGVGGWVFKDGRMC